MFNIERMEVTLNSEYFIQNPQDYSEDLQVKRQQMRFYLTHIIKFIEKHTEVAKNYYNLDTRIYTIPYKVLIESYTTDDTICYTMEGS
jgi:hypothetical protein